MTWRANLVQNVSPPLRHAGLQAGENRQDLLADLEQISKNVRNGNINSVVFSIFCRFCPIPVCCTAPSSCDQHCHMCVVLCALICDPRSSITGMMGSHSQFWSSSVIKTIPLALHWRGLSSIPRDCCGLWTNPSGPEQPPSGRGPHTSIFYLKFAFHVIF